jgi:type I restriction enzyme S subunit
MKPQRASLGELCILAKGLSPISKTSPGQYPLVTTGETHKTADSYQFDAEAVCIPLISSTGHGHASLKRVHYFNGKFALGNLLAAAFVKDRSLLSARFLARYLMFTKDRLIVPLMTGAANMSISVDRLATVPVILPTLTEQARIVRLLDEADELRILRCKADRQTASLLPALFHDMFGDPSTNSKGWPIHPAGELMAACDYGTSQKANEDGRGITVLRMGNVTARGELDLDNLKTVELSDSELAKQRLRPGDVLFNRTNSRELVGKTGMWDGRIEAVAASYFIRVRFLTKLELPQHFTAFMNLPFMKQKLMETARGAVGQANINSKDLKAMPVPLPPLELQNDFAQRVGEIRELEAGQAMSHERLDALFHSLLNQTLNGY